MWGTGTYPLESLPLRLWLFDDDLVIVDALPPYSDLIGARIIDDRRPPNRRRSSMPLATVIPRDNGQTVRLLTPRYLLIPQVLRGLGVATRPGCHPDAHRRRQRRSAGADDHADPMEDYNNWAGPYGLHLPADPDVRYLSRIDEDLWWELLAGRRDPVRPVQPRRASSRFRPERPPERRDRARTSPASSWTSATTSAARFPRSTRSLDDLR